MPRRGNLRRVVVFKVDEELSRFLADLPNTSVFVRQAVLAALNRRCPLCQGMGRVPIGVGGHYAGVIRDRPPATDSRKLNSSDAATAT